MSEQADNPHESQRWSQVIVRDMRDIARRAGTIALDGRRQAGLWWLRVGAWFRFVHRRRPDTRFAIFPDARRGAEILAVFGSIVLALALFADPVFLDMVNSRDPTLVAIFRQVTRLGQSAWVLYLTGAVVLGISLYPADGLARRRRVHLHGVLLIAYYVFTTVAFSGLLTDVIKNVVGRARPQFVPHGMVWYSVPFGGHYDYASFPSGHATTAGALAIALALLMPRLRVFVVLVGVWIAISRPVLGVHFPADIFAGFCLGGAFSYFYARSFARKRLLFAFGDNGELKMRPLPPRSANRLASSEGVGNGGAGNSGG